MRRTSILAFACAALAAGVGTVVPSGDIPDYVVSNSGAGYLASRPSDGATAYAGPDPGAAIQAAIDALGAGGGTIRLDPGTFAYASTVPAIPCGLAGRLVIAGAGPDKTTLKLAAGALTAFGLGPCGTTPATYQDFELREFAVDGGDLPSAEQDPIVFGTHLRAPKYTQFQDVTVRNVRSYNGDESSLRAHYQFATLHPAPESDNVDTVTQRVLLDHLEMDGAWTGVGFGCGADNPQCRHFIDQVTISNSRHSQPLATQDRAHPGTGFHVGAYADVGAVTLVNLLSENSSDDGIEVNQPRRALVQDCIVRNALIHGIVATNYRTDTTAYARSWTITGSEVVVDGSLAAMGPEDLRGVGFVVGGISTRTGTHMIDDVSIVGCRYTNTADGDGPFFLMGRTRNVTISGFESWSARSRAASSLPDAYNEDAWGRIWLEGDTPTTPHAVITLEHVHLAGSLVFRQDAARYLDVRGLSIGGPQVELHLHDYTFELGAAGFGNDQNAARGVCVGCYQYDFDQDGTNDVSRVSGDIVTARAAVGRAVTRQSADVTFGSAAKLVTTLHLSDLRTAMIAAPISFEGGALAGLSCENVPGYDATCRELPRDPLRPRRERDGSVIPLLRPRAR